MLIVAAIVIAALAFDFINGFHDAANAIATIVSTRVLTPRVAVLWAALFNVLAVVIFQLHVARTIGKGIVDPGIVDDAVLAGALGGAIVWNLLTWWWGLPSSSSHALVGGLVGAGITKGGTGVVVGSGITKTAIFIVASPLLGFVLASMLMVLAAWLFRRFAPGKVDAWSRRLQFVSAAMFSLGHGGNDAQKTIGIITALLVAKHYIAADSNPPNWVIAACYVAMGVGTMLGGWRIVKTMGMRLTKLKPSTAVCADLSGAMTLFLASGLGIPVSTTHTVTGSIVGVGWVSNPGRVRWGVASRIVWAWIFTIPASAIMAALVYFVLHALGV